MLTTVADRRTLPALMARLGRLRPDSERRWGTLTPHEMLCHLGDANEMVLRTRPRRTPLPERNRRLLKVAILWAPVPWPLGRPTNPEHNPRISGTQPSDFEADRRRVGRTLEGLAAARPADLEPAHGLSARCPRATGSGGRTGTWTITCGSLDSS